MNDHPCGGWCPPGHTIDDSGASCDFCNRWMSDGEWDAVRASLDPEPVGVVVCRSCEEGR